MGRKQRNRRRTVAPVVPLAQPPAPTQERAPSKVERMTIGQPTIEGFVEPISSWVLSSVKSALDQHEQGEFERSALLADYMDRNPRIRSAFDTRVNGVLGLDLTFEPAKGHKTQASRYVREFEEIWWDIIPETTLGELSHWVQRMGFAIGEATWAPIGNRWMPTIQVWHPTHARYNQLTRFIEVYDDNGVWHQVTPGDGRWILLAATRTRPWMRGVVRCLGVEDAARGQAVRDWARWSERHGLPIFKASFPGDETATQSTAAFFRGLTAAGRIGLVKCPQPSTKDAQGYNVDLLEPKTLSWEGFKALLERMDVDIAIAVLGQNLTSEVKGGSLAAAKVHDRVRGDYIRADVQLLTTGLREQLVKPYMRYNHGAEKVDLAPWPKWNATPPADLSEKAKTYYDFGNAVKTLREVNPLVDVEALFIEFGIPVLTPGEAKKAQEIEAQAKPESESEPEPEQDEMPDEGEGEEQDDEEADEE